MQVADGVFQVSELHETGGEPFIQSSDQCGPQIILSESGLSCAFVIHTRIKIFHISSNSISFCSLSNFQLSHGTIFSFNI